MNTLFNGQLDFDNIDELELVLDNLNSQMSIKILEIGLQHALQYGAYSLTESHCLYKSLQYLKNHENKNSNIRDDDSHGNID